MASNAYSTVTDAAVEAHYVNVTVSVPHYLQGGLVAHTETVKHGMFL